MYFSKAVSIDEIEKNRFSLSIPLYIEKEPSEKDERSLNQHYVAWHSCSENMRKSYDLLNNMIVQEGCNNA